MIQIQELSVLPLTPHICAVTQSLQAMLKTLCLETPTHADKKAEEASRALSALRLDQVSWSCAHTFLRIRETDKRFPLFLSAYTFDCSGVNKIGFIKSSKEAAFAHIHACLWM